MFNPAFVARIELCYLSDPPESQEFFLFNLTSSYRKNPYTEIVCRECEEFTEFLHRNGETPHIHCVTCLEVNYLMPW